MILDETVTTSLKKRARSIGRAVQGRTSQGIDALEHLPDVEDRIRAAATVVTPLGRTAIVVGVGAWTLGWWLGWLEFMILAGTCLLLMIAASIFAVGRSPVEIEVSLSPTRLVAGEPSAGEITIRNRSARRAAAGRVELPIGSAIAEFDLPSLAPGRRASDLFVIPTGHRGVIPVGPATVVRGDPLGLLRRTVASSDPTELIVHPHTVALEPFGSGLLRDLEGLTSKDLTSSDLAFHALREYTPGDDRRFVHWKSSAKAGRLMVRQYLETRRSTLCVVVDGSMEGYASPAEFETALEVAGSVAVRACADDLPATIAAGNQAATGATAPHLLDALARVELGTQSGDLATLVSRVTASGADISFAVLISGSERTPDDLQRSATRFPPEVRVLAIRVIAGEAPSFQRGARITAMKLGQIGDLPRLLRSELLA